MTGAQAKYSCKECAKRTIGKREWVVTIYMLMMGVIIPFSGWAGDRFGYKQLYIVSRVSGSFGITVLTGILTGRTTFYTAITSWSILPSGFGVTQLMQNFSYVFGNAQATMSQAKALGFSVLSGLIEEDAFVRGIDIFLIAAAVVIIGLIPAIFLRSGKKGKAKNF
jgi:MFS family permease